MGIFLIAKHVDNPKLALFINSSNLRTRMIHKYIFECCSSARTAIFYLLSYEVLTHG